MKKLNTLLCTSAFILQSVLLSGCKVPFIGKDDEETTSNTYIFVASGTAYAGTGLTPSTPTQTVTRYRSDGVYDGIVFDYNTLPGDSPVGLAEYGSEYLLVLIENGSGRRVDIVRKDGSSDNPAVYIPSGAGLGSQVRSIFPTFDNGLLLARTAAVEKFNSSNNRLLQGANPWINNPTGTCATTNTAVVGVTQGPNNNIIYTHAAASTNHKTVMIKPTGWTGVAGDCLSAVSGSTANHIPTGGLLYYTYSGLSRLLVAYSNNTGPINEIWQYPVSSTTISAGAVSILGQGRLKGISRIRSMTDGTILVSNASSDTNSIEKLTYNTSTHVMDFATSSAFITTDAFTKSISDFIVSTGNF